MIQNNPNHPNQCGKPNDKHTIGGLFIGALQMVMTWGLFMKLGLPQMGCSPQITSPMGDLLTRIINQLLTGMILQGALDLIGKLKNTSSKIGRSWCKTFTVRPEYMIYIYMHIPTHLHSTCVNTHVYQPKHVYMMEAHKIHTHIYILFIFIYLFIYFVYLFIYL